MLCKGKLLMQQKHRPHLPAYGKPVAVFSLGQHWQSQRTESGECRRMSGLHPEEV